MYCMVYNCTVRNCHRSEYTHCTVQLAHFRIDPCSKHRSWPRMFSRECSYTELDYDRNLTIVKLILAKKNMNSETLMKYKLTNTVFGCLLRCTCDKEKCIHGPRYENEDLLVTLKKPFTSSCSSRIAYG